MPDVDKFRNVIYCSLSQDLQACRQTWHLTDTDLCPLCGETQTMSSIIESCPFTKLNGVCLSFTLLMMLVDQLWILNRICKKKFCTPPKISWTFIHDFRVILFNVSKRWKSRKISISSSLWAMIVIMLCLSRRLLQDCSCIDWCYMQSVVYKLWLVTTENVSG